LKKIKVTKTVHKKTKLLERPVALIGLIALVLLIGGFMMAQFSGKAREKGIEATVFGTGEAAPATTASETPAGATPAAAPAATLAAAPVLPHILEIGASLPQAGPGDLLPPLQVRTHPDALQARAALRGARASGEASPAGTFVDVKDIAALAAQGTAGPAAWAALATRPEQRAWCDFEIQHGSQGETYLLAFVPADVAEAFGELAPDLALTPPPPGATHPWWQIWKKRPEPAGIVLHQGTRLDLYPDINPGADCLIALPVAHVVPRATRSIQTGLPAAAEVLEVELR
jgi:hypothetical protein